MQVSHRRFKPMTHELTLQTMRMCF